MTRPKLKPVELRAYLDANIRSKARWKMGDNDFDVSPGSLIQGSSDDDVKKVAQDVYDSIVSSFDYDEMLVNATRSVTRFGVGYVSRVIKAAIKSGSIATEMDLAVIAAVNEKFKGKKVKKKDGQSDSQNS